MVWVAVDICKKAEGLLRAGGQKTREGVELLLQNDLSGGTNVAVPGAIDAREMLSKGLKALELCPHAVLDVAIGAQTIDIRKAYKKAALKYHPDKNPKTTPLFQAIQSACDKLSDRDQRARAEQKAAVPKAPPPAPTPAAPSAGAGSRASHHQQQQQQPPSANWQWHHQQQQYGQAPKGYYKGYEQNGPRRPGAPAAHQKPQAPPPPSQQQQQQPTPKYTAYDQKTSSSQPPQPPQPTPRYSEQQPPRYTAYDHKTSSNNSDYKPPKMPDFEEEIRRRTKAAAEKRAEELKAAAAKEAAAQRDRDEIYKQGQKAYFDEQAKLRRAATERERMAAEAADARRRAVYGENPTPMYRAPSNPPPVPPSSSNVEPPKCKPPTNPAAHGNVAADKANAAAEAAYNNYNYKKKYEVPVPIAFKCTASTETSVELEWRISLYCTKAVLIELSWRRQVNTSAWQSAPKLISGFKCKKNNLDLGGAAGNNTIP